MTELIGWLIFIAIVIAVLRLIWPFIVLGIAAYIAIRIGRRLIERHAKAVAVRRAARDAICVRADAQHALVLRGDPAGVYGDYPAPDLGGQDPVWWPRDQPGRRTG